MSENSSNKRSNIMGNNRNLLTKDILKIIFGLSKPSVKARLLKVSKGFNSIAKEVIEKKIIVEENDQYADVYPFIQKHLKNYLIAGGHALKCFEGIKNWPHETIDEKSYQKVVIRQSNIPVDTRTYVPREDLDIFFYGLSREEWYKSAVRFAEELQRHPRDKYKWIHTEVNPSKGIYKIFEFAIGSGEYYRKIELIFSEYTNPLDIIQDFDLELVSIGFTINNGYYNFVTTPAWLETIGREETIVYYNPNHPLGDPTQRFMPPPQIYQTNLTIHTTLHTTKLPERIHKYRTRGYKITCIPSITEDTLVRSIEAKEARRTRYLVINYHN